MNSPGDIKLANNTTERKLWDDLGNLYSLLKTIDYVEKAWSADYITEKEYNASITKLLNQWKTTFKAMSATVRDPARFLKDFSLTAPAALKRIAAGVPATAEYASGQAKSETQAVMQATQCFITLMDRITMAQSTFDLTNGDFLIDLTDIYSNLGKCTSSVPSSWSGRATLKQWMDKMSSRGALECLSETDLGEALHMLNSVYADFHRLLEA